MSQLSLFKGLVGRVSVLMVFVVGAVGLFLMMGGLGEGQETPGRRGSIIRRMGRRRLWHI